MKAWRASAGAVAAGFLVTAIASTAADAAMHALGVLPSSAQVMSDPLFALASAYRALFAIAGGYTTARLAPRHPMFHAWILAADLEIGSRPGSGQERVRPISPIKPTSWLRWL